MKATQLLVYYENKPFFMFFYFTLFHPPKILPCPCRDLQLEDYMDLYWRDYPSLINGFTESCLIDQCNSTVIVFWAAENATFHTSHLLSALIAQMQHPSFLRAEPPCVFSWLSSCLRGEDVQPFPYLPDVCLRIRLLVLVRLLMYANPQKSLKMSTIKTNK